MVLAVSARWADVVTDSFEWVTWIPPTAWLVISVPGLIVAEICTSLLSPRPRWMFFGAAIPVVVLLTMMIVYDWRPSGPLPHKSDDQLRIAFVNASHPHEMVETTAAEKLLALKADVVVMTDAARLYGALQEQLKEVQNPPRLANTFRVSVLTDLTIKQLTTAFATKDIAGVTVEVEMKNGRLFRMLVVDFPSNPTDSRTKIAQEFRTFIKDDETGDYDLIVGDFNMTPVSGAINMASGNARNVFQVAGSGWGGTWPNSRPILRLDHGLVPSEMEVLDARTFNIGVAHRGLLITLKPHAVEKQPPVKE